MRTGILIVCAALLVVTAAIASEDPSIKPREWIINAQASNQTNFTATFLKYENGYVYVTMPDGHVQKIMAAQLEGKSLAYLQRVLCEMPKNITKPQASGTETEPLIDLSVDNLSYGQITKWENRGSLGGAFHALRTPLPVEEIDGKKAVRFYYGPWALPLEFHAMVADFYAPQLLTTNQAYTVVAWLYNPSPLGVDGNRETVLSWHSINGDDGTDIGYGQEGRYSHEKGTRGGAYLGPMGGFGFPDEVFPALNQWHQIAYVFTGSQDGVFRIYIDGKFAFEKSFNRIIRNLPAIEIGSNEATLQAGLILRDGKPARVTVCVGESDNHYWRSTERWQQVINLGLKDPGTISTKITGLKPGTRYYYRFVLEAENETRWADGAGSFVTAGEDGTPGKNLPPTDEKLMFLGCSWGSTWDWAVKPQMMYTGGIADLKVYGRALSEQEVRNLFGYHSAYSENPRNGSETDDLDVKLSWKPGDNGVKSYRVYLSSDGERIQKGEGLKSEQADTTFQTGRLELGKKYFWRVDQVMGNGNIVEGEVWSFTACSGNASNPTPADKTTNASIYTGKFTWKPGRYARAHRVYLGTNREAVEKGDGDGVWRSGVLDKNETTWSPNEGNVPISLEYGRTYYWRVEELNDGNLPNSKGEIWQFTVENYFEPEFDGLVSEPFPRSVRQDGYYGKLMEGNGQPVIAAADCPDQPMRLCSYTMSKVLRKRPDIVEVMEALNCAASLDYGDRGWGFSEFTCQAYGNVRTFNYDPTFYWGLNIMVHEMGHQFHMYGAEQEEADFRQRLFNVFWSDKKEGKWIGDYGGLNMWEMMAVCASAFCSDGSEDDLICRREQLRQNDPRMFYLLQDYWPGDMLIELIPSTGLHTDSAYNVIQWENNGGIEYWGKFGLKKHDRTVGAFEAKGNPKLATVKGVTAVRFGGTDALVWNRRTQECLIENHAWSVELWALKDAGVSTEDEIILGWGQNDSGIRLLLGSNDAAIKQSDRVLLKWNKKPQAGTWHHIVYVFKGGGIENTAGLCSVYIDGVLDNTSKFKLNIPSGQTIFVGGAFDGKLVTSGFKGALAHIRVYDYDLSELQIIKHYKEENSFYKREALEVAGHLLLDFDAEQISPCPTYETRTTYPASTGRDWVRSWYNRGSIAGKMQNDKHMPENSDPQIKVINGITGIAFMDNDRMVSSFSAGKEISQSQPITFELWIYRDKTDKGGTVFQWGRYSFNAAELNPGTWHHVALVMRWPDCTIFVDGKRLKTISHLISPSYEDRLHFGAFWDGNQWSRYFNGAIAQFRLHRGILNEKQIAANYNASRLMIPSHPTPAIGEKVVASRKLTLRWDPGLRSKKPEFDLYLGTNMAEVASADKRSKVYQGRYSSGKYSPSLKQGTVYYWRVDGLDANGKPVSRGPMWTFRTYEGLLVELDAENLQPGKIEKWKNNGRSGGEFTVGNIGNLHAPVVETEITSNRKAVNFVGGKYLVSSFQTPGSLTDNKPFSVLLWVYNYDIQERETMLSWGGKNAPAEFIYGRNSDDGAFRNTDRFKMGYGGQVSKPDLWRFNAPMPTFWHQLAYVYSGGQDGVLRIYTDGILNTERRGTLKISEGGHISIGAIVNDDGGVEWPYSGFISDVAIYSTALTDAEVKALYENGDKALENIKPIVKLTSDNLSEGKLLTWKNEGSAGGEFHIPTFRRTEPIVETVSGRKAVTFNGNSFMKSNITTPSSVTRINPFTIETLVYNPEVSGNETVFSLAPRQAFDTTYPEGEIERALEIRYALGHEREPGALHTGWGVRSIGWKDGKYPAAGEWHHIAFVYDGRHQGACKVYVDGKLNSMREYYTLCTNSGLPMYLGTAFNTSIGPIDGFSGSIAELKVYDYAKLDSEIMHDARAYQTANVMQSQKDKTRRSP